MGAATIGRRQSAVGKIVLATAVYALSVLAALGQAAPTYTVTQITNDSTNHESPSINDKGQIVWSQQIPVGSALLWQVQERDIRSANRSAAPVAVPDQNHNFQFPVIDNAGDIVYLKDHAGEGAALEVVKNQGGSETIIEFSSQNGASVRVAGQHFGISSNGTTISYFSFCQQSCTQTFDVNQSSIPDNLIQYFVPDINDNSTFAFVFNHQVCTALVSDPVNSRDCSIGGGDLPRITNPQLRWDVSSGKIVAHAEVVYINSGHVVSTFGGVIDNGTWADVNNLGMIVYEKTDSNGFNQIFLATPYWQQCHTDPTTLHWGPEKYAGQPNESMCGRGCLTTSLSRVLATEGVASISIANAGQEANDPGNLNTFMDQHPGDYVGDNAKPYPTIRHVGLALGNGKLKWCGRLPLPTDSCPNSSRLVVDEVGQVGQAPSGAEQQAIADLENIVSQSKLPVVYVTSRISHVFRHHFVVVVGIVSDSTCSSYFDGKSCVDFLIADPFGSPSDDTNNLNVPSNLPYTTLSQYGIFGIQGFVADPQDNSGLELAVGENVSPLVVDAAGRRTGLDPNTGAILEEIPGSAYFDTSVDDEDIIDAGHVFGLPTPTTHSVDIDQPLQGSYTIILNGVRSGSYSLAITAFSQDGSAQSSLSLQGNAQSGSTSTSTLQFSPIPGSSPTLSSSDKTPPTTIAAVSPAPNANGWNNTDVTIALTSVDNPNGSGVKQITYSATGAQTISSTTLFASSASVTVSTEGITTITFFGADNAGNIETTKTITIKLDKTPPSITGARTPPPNASGWNNTAITVSFQCADSLSGLAAGSPPAPSILTTQGVGQTVSGTCTDMADNSASATLQAINIDLTPPVLTVMSNPPPNTNGWNNSTVTISFAAVDNLSGVAGVSPPVTITLEGAGQVVIGSAMDLAGNVASGSVTINLDKTPPEAFIQFDPVRHDVLLFGRDSLSGVAPGPVTPISVQRVGNWDNDDHDESRRSNEGDDSKVEIRTYKILDLAGNSLLLVEKVSKREHELRAKILTVQYNHGSVTTLLRNEEIFEWELGRDGSLKELDQELRVSSMREGPRIEASFDSRTNRTTIRQEEPEPRTKIVKSGLDLLHMATTGGKLAIEF